MGDGSGDCVGDGGCDCVGDVAGLGDGGGVGDQPSNKSVLAVIYQCLGKPQKYI